MSYPSPLYLFPSSESYTACYKDEVITNRDYMTDICSMMEKELGLKYWNGGIQLQLKTRKERYRSRLNKLYIR
jgi:hypothetical protein